MFVRSRCCLFRKQPCTLYFDAAVDEFVLQGLEPADGPAEGMFFLHLSYP